MYHPFSVTETIGTAWSILKKNFATIAVYTLLAFVIINGYWLCYLRFIFDRYYLNIIRLLFYPRLGISFIFLGFIKLSFSTD